MKTIGYPNTITLRIGRLIRRLRDREPCRCSGCPHSPYICPRSRRYPA